MVAYCAASDDDTIVETIDLDNMNQESWLTEVPDRIYESIRVEIKMNRISQRIVEALKSAEQLLLAKEQVSLGFNPLLRLTCHYLPHQTQDQD
jgi:hypothetical protein